MVGNRTDTRVSPIAWKSKLIRKACRSRKDAELLSLSAVCDHAIHVGKQLEEILYRNRDGTKYKPVIFTDNACTLESIVSSKLIERRYLRPDMNIMKEFVKNKDVACIVWIPDELQIADILTKDKITKIGVFELMAYGELNVVRNRENYVSFDGEDYVMKGQHLRSQIIKAKKIPMKKRVKGKEVAKNESKMMENEDDEGMIS